MQLTANESQTDIAKELGISDWTVRRVIFNLDQFFKPCYYWLLRTFVILKHPPQYYN